MNKKGWIVLGIVAVIILLVVFFPSGNEVQAPTDEEIVNVEINTDNVETDDLVAGDQSDTTPAAEVSTTTFTVEEIVLHNTPQDCWISIDGKVHDVTPFIEKGLHPGEEKILLGCGQEDASNIYDGTDGPHEHSDDARNLLEDYYIGDVVVAEDV